MRYAGLLLLTVPLLFQGCSARGNSLTFEGENELLEEALISLDINRMQLMGSVHGSDITKYFIDGTGLLKSYLKIIHVLESTSKIPESDIRLFKGIEGHLDKISSAPAQADDSEKAYSLRRKLADSLAIKQKYCEVILSSRKQKGKK